MAVVWGPREVLADATLSVGDGSLSLARDPMALTATFQEEEFEQYCARTMAQLPDLSAASLRLTARDDNAWVLKVYRDGGNLAMCAWQMLPDDRANGISYNGPAASVGSSAKATLGTTLSMIETNGSHAWMTGIIPDGTETVDVVLSDGSTVRAQIGDGVYLAWVPGTGAHAKLVMTTATTIYTVAEGKVSQRPR